MSIQSQDQGAGMKTGLDASANAEIIRTGIWIYKCDYIFSEPSGYQVLLAIWKQKRLPLTVSQ